MKHTLTSSLFILTSSFLAAFGAANDTLISFSTPGPDKYADGTTVLDGESYALVWTKDKAEFAGLAADGKVVDSENSAVLVYAPVAKGGRCPTVVFELDAAIAAKYSGGSFSVYLLDTRLADGRVGGLNAKGLPVAVNGYGAASGFSSSSGSSSSVGSSFASASIASTVAVTTKSAVPADAPKPQITSIKVVGANVIMTVKGTLPCLKYVANEVTVGGCAREVTSTTGEASTTGELRSARDSRAQPVQGAATTDEEITVIVPKQGDSGFFKVTRE